MSAHTLLPVFIYKGFIQQALFLHVLHCPKQHIPPAETGEKENSPGECKDAFDIQRAHQ